MGYTLVKDPAQLEAGDVIEVRYGVWRIVTDVREASHPLASHRGAMRVDVLGWQERRPMVLTLWPGGLPLYRVGRLEELEPGAMTDLEPGRVSA